MKNIQGIKIRKTQVSDAEQIIKLENLVSRVAYAHMFSGEVFDNNESRTEELIQKFKTYGLNENGGLDLVAIDGEKIVAFVAAVPLSFCEHYKELGYAELGEIYIDPDYQNLGLGKMLFNMVVKHFKELGCKMIVIGVFEENMRARKVYEKWGCVLDTTYKKSFKKIGKECPGVFYLKTLA